jgi:hypothetical protein
MPIQAQPPVPPGAAAAADRQLLADLGPWLAQRHTGANKAAVNAVLRWRKARNI